MSGMSIPPISHTLNTGPSVAPGHTVPHHEGTFVTGTQDLNKYQAHSADLPSAALLVEEEEDAAASAARPNIPLTASKLKTRQHGLDIQDIEHRYTRPNNGADSAGSRNTITYDTEFHNYAMFATTAELNKDFETLDGNFHDSTLDTGLDIGIAAAKVGLSFVLSPLGSFVVGMLLSGAKDLGMHISHKNSLKRANSIIRRAETKTGETLDPFRMGYLYAESTLRDFYTSYSHLLSQIDYEKHGGKKKIAEKLVSTLFSESVVKQLKTDNRNLVQIAESKIMDFFKGYGVHDEQYESGRALRKSRSIG